MICRLCKSTRLVSVLTSARRHRVKPSSPLTARSAGADYPAAPPGLRRLSALQIPALITPEDTFTEYAYFSSYSDSWVQHAKRFVYDAKHASDLGADSFVVEVASNDGYLLQHAVAWGIRCLGIEPSVNVGVAARKRGVPTKTAFLDEQLAAAVRDEHGRPISSSPTTSTRTFPIYSGSPDRCADCWPTTVG